MKKISIIMPLYNAAKYLEECLDSVLQQTFTEFELICVNDASMDSTLEILQKYQKKDDRIRIFSNMTRSGAAYSRNHGMEYAQGEYLSFLDGDDIYDEEMFQAAYQMAVRHDADIVMYEYRHVASDQIHDKLEVFHSRKYRERYCQKPFSIVEQEPYECLNWGLSPWNKIYRREFVRKNQLFFQDLPSSNDVYFVCMALMLSQRSILLDDERVMVYARDHDEETRISSDRDPMCSYLAFLHLAEELTDRGLFCNLYPYFYYRFGRAMKSALRQCKTEEKAKDFYRFLQKEGIDKMRFMAGAAYDKLDDFIKNYIGRFQSMSFDSGWYKKELGLGMQLSQKVNENAVIELFENYRKLHQKICIWGAGANGVSLLAFCRQNNLQVDMVVDKSKEKQGCIIEGYRVKAPEDIAHQLEVMIVSSRHIAESVEEFLAGKNIEVLDINQFLCIY